MSSNPASIRIGTWNLDGRGSASQTELLLAQQCDVLLLTEVPIDWSLPGYHLSRNGSLMRPTKRWAAVASRSPLIELQATHDASAVAIVDGVTYVSSVLPWRAASGDPWRGDDQATRTINAVSDLEPFLRSQRELVWGGDWNQALSGREYVGTGEGRAAITSLLRSLDLEAPTTDLPHQRPGATAIDHIALRGIVHRAARVIAPIAGTRPISDHAMYVVDATLSRARHASLTTASAAG